MTDSPDIAIVGMAGRFAGANNLDQYWSNLRGGVESIQTLTDDELRAAGVGEALLANPNYVKAAAVLPGMELFDAGLFGFNPREASIMDPQHRHFLECSWEAFENAGHVPDQFSGRIGVFAGSGHNAYMPFNLLSNPKLVSSVGFFLLRHTGNDKDFLTTRVSYLLNLKGPSIAVQTACSTSLVAIHLACQSLLNGECDMALAGGVTIELPHRQGYLFQEGEILSPDGHCRAFDAGSSGTVFGSGVGVVVLRRLNDALADGDHIHAVIKGTAVNNDGAGKVGYLAPSVDGQAQVIAEALAVADVSAETITYVECHGTGTPVGDPIEVAALTQAFRQSTTKAGYCGIGSVKTNIGHTDTAAGVASLIKVALALQHREIPPSLHFEQPNASCGFVDSPFFVNAELRAWAPLQGNPRRAGVTSLGVGGTNAHVVLEESPAAGGSGPSRDHQLLVLSARTSTALDAGAAALAAHFKSNSSVNIADAAHTLRVGRRSMRCRRYVVAGDASAAIAALENPDPQRSVVNAGGATERTVAFMFPGGGAQYVRMGAGLYQTEPVFRQAIDECFRLLQGISSADIKSAIYPSQEEEVEATRQLERPSVALPALFTVQLALARLWMSWGIQPSAMIGHSMGEYTAAHLAGVFSLSDALSLVALRGRLFEQLPEGAMVSVPLPLADVNSLISTDLSVAAVNGPAATVVSGPTAAIERLQRQLTTRGIEAIRVRISVAAHSAMLEPVLNEFQRLLETVKMAPPALPFISNLSGTWIETHEATDPLYWVRHLRNTVQFSGGLRELLADPRRVLLEVGPGRTLSSLVKQHPDRSPSQPILSSLRHPEENVHDQAFVLDVLGKLWTHGTPVDWDGFRGAETRVRVPLPTYAFDHQHYWVEPGRVSTVDEPDEISLERRSDQSDWFYEPVWTRTPHPLPRPTSANCLVFLDDTGLGDALVTRLRGRGQTVAVVRRGESYSRGADDAFTIDPGNAGDYDALIQALVGSDITPQHIYHLWMVDDVRFANASGEEIDRLETQGFYSLLWLAQGIGSEALSEPIRVAVISNGMQRVAGEPIPAPVKATLLGPCRVIPQEFPNIRCCSVDVQLPGGSSRITSALVEALAAELTSEHLDEVVAYRASDRWIQGFTPSRLPELPTGQTTLRRHGVYLITGGFGGVALALARHLAASYEARLVLVGRRGLPPRGEWNEVLEQGEGAEITHAIEEVFALEALGAEVMIATADVADLPAMRTVVADAQKRFGPIHGVLHAAGVIDDGVLQLKTSKAAAEVLRPKVRGTLVLDEVLRGLTLDFVVLFSSVSSFAGLAGQVDYAAANAFLDAYAQDRAARGGPHTVAVNWGQWQDVGMAAAMAQRLGLLSPNTDCGPALRTMAHPLIDECVKDAPDERIYRTRLSCERHWVLSEHRLRGGHALIPGTAYLELARAAFSDGRDTSGIQLTNVTFLEPLVVSDNERREIRIHLRTEGPQSARFRIVSVLNATGAMPSECIEHARGRVGVAALRTVAGQPIDTIRARCSTRSVALDGQEKSTHMSFGPRWSNVTRIAYGDGESLIDLRLPESYASDLLAVSIHPALMDMATAGSQRLIPGFDESAQFYVPASYGNVRIHGPLQASIASHVRYREDASLGPDAAVFDVTVLGEHGAVLVEVEGFTMIQLRDKKLFGAVGGERHRTGTAPKARAIANDALSIGAQHGLRSSEGGAVLDRVLSSSRPQVVVSPLDLDALVRRLRKPAVPASSGEGARAQTPDSTTDLATPTERMVAAIWGELLGIEQIRAADNFLELGGHSLLVMQMAARLRRTLGTSPSLPALFEARTLRELAAGIDGVADAQPVQPARIPAREEQDQAPLSLMQERLYFLESMYPGRTTYNIPQALTLSGRLDIVALEQAINALVARQSSLRTVIRKSAAGDAYQVVLSSMPLSLPVDDLSGIALDQRQQGVATRLRELALDVFDLARGPLFKAHVLRVSDEEHILFYMTHHIISDGLSLLLLQQELETLYVGMSNGDAPALPTLRVTYGDYSSWHRSQMEGPDLAQGVSKWVERLSGISEPLNLPTDLPRPPHTSNGAGTVSRRVTAAQVERLRSLAAIDEATLYMAMLACYVIFLHRQTGQREFVIGMPVRGRGDVDVESLIGFFANTIALRLGVRPEDSFRDVLRTTRTALLDAFSQPDVPFERIVRELKLPRDDSRFPVYQTLFALQDLRERPTRFGPELSVQPLNLPVTGIAEDLTLWLYEDTEGIAADLAYSTDLFSPDTATAFADRYLQLIDQLIDGPDQSVGDLLLTLPAEGQLLAKWNGTVVALDQQIRVHDLIEEQASLRPGKTAVSFGDRSVTYGELDAQANRLAHLLRARGIGRGSLVGLCLERGIDLIVALVATLKSGAAYVPLDPTYPKERLTFMAEDAELALLVTKSSLTDLLTWPRARSLWLDADNAAVSAQPVSRVLPGGAEDASAADPAYVIYTSGSTGKPKGVVVPHRSVVNLFKSVEKQPGMSSADTVLAVTTLSFDIAVAEFVMPLTVGGSIVIADERQVVDGMQLRQLVESAGITFIDATPSTWRLLLTAGWRGSSRVTAICTGEPLPQDLAVTLVPRVGVLWNMYGPTETTVWSSLWEVRNPESGITIGRPIANTQILVLDEKHRPCPIGVPGELYIGGAGLAIGYLKRDELTNQRFVEMPPGSGQRLYRTGDLGRWRHDGVIEHMGRLDHQVKVRGHRIELGEVETTIASHPAVTRALVVAHEFSPGDVRLVAYVVLATDVPLNDVREHARRTLPAYMVPHHVVSLDRIPQLPNGKIDRKSLPPPVETPPEVSERFELPRTPDEESLAGIWREVLGKKSVGVHDDFFDVGGHSLTAMQVIVRIQKVFGVDCPLALIFEAPTLEAMTERLIALRESATSTASSAQLTAVPRGASLPVSFSQRQMWLLQQSDPDSVAYSIPFALRLRGELNRRALEAALGQMIERHEAFRTTFAVGQDEPVQIITNTADLYLVEHDLAETSEGDKEAEMMRLLRELSMVPFDLEHGPLHRFCLVRLSAADHALLLLFHHSVCDEWSFGILQKELSVAYNTIRRGEELQSRLPAFDYADYAVWQRQTWSADRLDEQSAFWRRTLAGIAPLSLPTDRQPSRVTSRGGLEEMPLPPSTIESIRAVASELSTTPFNVLLTAFNLLLARYCRQDDLPVGVPVSNRSVLHAEQIVGAFTNTVILRTDLAGVDTFPQLVRRVTDATVDATANRDIPFDEVVAAIRRHGGPIPEVQVLFNVLNTSGEALDFDGINGGLFSVDRGATQAPLSLFVDLDSRQLVCLNYATDLFVAEFAARLLANYVALLNELIADPAKRLCDYVVLSDTEHQRIMEWNATTRDYPLERTLHSLIEAQVERSPNMPAVSFEGQSLTYRELDMRANQLAHLLRDRQVGPDTMVGVCMERSVELMVALLAVLKAGGAYVPLDPSYPADRLEFMIQDAEAPMVLIQERLRPVLTSYKGRTIAIDSEAASFAGQPTTKPVVPMASDHLAYMIYTSGSTGRPKGAMNTHRGIVNRLLWMQDEYRIDPTDRILQKTPFSFDVSVWEFFWPLLTGAQLVMARPEGHKDPRYLIDVIKEQGITTLHFVPSMLQAFVREPGVSECTSIRRVVCSGEALPADLQNAFFDVLSCELHNLYGPTEAAVDVTYWACSPDPLARSVPIGRPIANTQIHILDPHLNPVPIGAPGELHIGGVNVGRGYHRRPELSAEKFINDPFSGTPGAKLYKTGDLAKFRADGSIEYLGRLDHQVKIRGFRVELGEIEASLVAHPSVSTAVVITREDRPGDLRLVAYLVPRGPLGSIQELRDHLRVTLPEYMVPAHFVAIQSIPVTPNGKLDRKALPVPMSAVSMPDSERPQPETPFEIAIAEIWKDCLGVDRVSATDTFFDLGGHSLLATRALIEVDKKFGVRLQINQMIVDTLAQVAAAVEKQVTDPVVATGGGGWLRRLKQTLWT